MEGFTVAHENAEKEARNRGLEPFKVYLSIKLHKLKAASHLRGKNVILCCERTTETVATETPIQIDATEEIIFVDEKIDLYIVMSRRNENNTGDKKIDKQILNGEPISGFEAAMARLTLRNQSESGAVLDCTSINLAKFITGQNSVSEAEISLQLGGTLFLSIGTKVYIDGCNEELGEVEVEEGREGREEGEEGEGEDEREEEDEESGDEESEDDDYESDDDSNPFKKMKLEKTEGQNKSTGSNGECSKSNYFSSKSNEKPKSSGGLEGSRQKCEGDVREIDHGKSKETGNGGEVSNMDQHDATNEQIGELRFQIGIMGKYIFQLQAELRGLLIENKKLKKLLGKMEGGGSEEACLEVESLPEHRDKEWGRSGGDEGKIISLQRELKEEKEKISEFRKEHKRLLEVILALKSELDGETEGGDQLTKELNEVKMQLAEQKRTREKWSLKLQNNKTNSKDTGHKLKSRQDGKEKSKTRHSNPNRLIDKKEKEESSKAEKKWDSKKKPESEKEDISIPKPKQKNKGFFGFGGGGNRTPKEGN